MPYHGHGQVRYLALILWFGGPRVVRDLYCSASSSSLPMRYARREFNRHAPWLSLLLVLVSAVSMNPDIMQALRLVVAVVLSLVYALQSLSSKGPLAVP